MYIIRIGTQKCSFPCNININRAVHVSDIFPLKTSLYKVKPVAANFRITHFIYINCLRLEYIITALGMLQ